MQRFLALLALSFLLFHSAHAEIPKTISYQGVLTEANGAPASGLKTLTFRLHDAATAGNVVWCEQQDVILGTGGVFSVLLGLGSPVAGCANANLGSVIFDKPCWLAIIVDGAEQPRIPLSAVPYSLNRHSSLDASDGDPRNSVYVDSSGKVGIGTTSPQRHLHVVGSPEVAFFQGPNGSIDIDGGGTRITGSNGIHFRGQESGESRMTLTPDGNLGIGTSTPNASLSIAGAVSLLESETAPPATPGFGMLYAKPDAAGTIDAFTKLLLHMDGANGATTFSDYSGRAHTVTVVGNAQVSTAQSRFGGSSASFDGTGDNLSIPASPDFGFGQGDFTVEAWIYARNWAASGFSGIVGNHYAGTADGSWYFQINSSGKLAFGVAGEFSGATSLSKDRWYHVAVSRFVDILRFFVDGRLDASMTFPDNISGGRPLYIGNLSNANNYFNGYIDELRISKGIARWTHDFTPSTTPYPIRVPGQLYYKGSDGVETPLGGH